jgi:uncharacterized protein DUF5110
MGRVWAHAANQRKPSKLPFSGKSQFKTANLLGANADFTLYEDQGDSYDYERSIFDYFHFIFIGATKRKLSSLEIVKALSPECSNTERLTP